MALLTHLRTGRSLALPARALVGRHPSCLVTLSDPLSSSEHATLRWREDAWWVRDLGSSNGTFVGADRLDAGAEARITAGARLGFGNATDLWVLEDGGPPGLFARSMDRQAVVFATDGVLLLPDDSKPEWALVQEREIWVVDDHERKPVLDGQIVSVADERWQICLPGGVAPTQRPVSKDAVVRFRVSRDEEFVEIDVVEDGRTTQLGSRAFNYLLLTLARLRLDDTHPDPQARGWVDRDDLAHQLRLQSNSLNVQLFRARKALGAVREDLAVRAVERRVRTSQIRFGFDTAEIETI